MQALGMMALSPKGIMVSFRLGQLGLPQQQLVLELLHLCVWGLNPQAMAACRDSPVIRAAASPLVLSRPLSFLCLRSPPSRTGSVPTRPPCFGPGCSPEGVGCLSWLLWPSSYGGRATCFCCCCLLSGCSVCHCHRFCPAASPGPLLLSVCHSILCKQLSQLCWWWRLKETRTWKYHLGETFYWAWYCSSRVVHGRCHPQPSYNIGN